jgi:hypothetical protein
MDETVETVGKVADKTTDKTAEKIVGIRPDIAIHNATGTSNPDVVKLMETLLEKAKSGEIQQVAVAFAGNNESATCLGGGVSIGLVGAVALLQNYLLCCMVATDERRTDE